jgi:methionyl-tRNA formyltransferase
VLESDSGRLVIACGQGALAVTRLQRSGGKPMSTEEFVRGTRIERGALLDPTSTAV